MTYLGPLNLCVPKTENKQFALNYFIEQIYCLRNSVEFKMMFIAASSILKKLLTGAACTVKSLNIDYYLKNNLIGK